MNLITVKRLYLIVKKSYELVNMLSPKHIEIVYENKRKYKHEQKKKAS